VDPAEALPDDPLGTRSIPTHFDLTCEFLLRTFITTCITSPLQNHRLCLSCIGKLDKLLHSLIVISP
jgi:hypothetical protein